MRSEYKIDMAGRKGRRHRLHKRGSFTACDTFGNDINLCSACPTCVGPCPTNPLSMAPIKSGTQAGSTIAGDEALGVFNNCQCCQQTYYKRKGRYSVAKEAVYINLLKWMKVNGFNCRTNFLIPSEFIGTGRGLLGKKAFANGEVIVEVPHRLLLTTSVVFLSYLGDLIRRWHRKFSPVQVMCLYLICERARGANSFWYHYLESLPKTYTNAVYWKERYISLIPSRFRYHFEEQISEVKRSYDELHEFVIAMGQKLPAVDIFGFHQYRWAWSTINTRGVYYLQSPNSCLNNEIDHIALAPFLDLLNHSEEAQVDAGYCAHSQSYRIKTETSTKRFRQVFINYGPHSNIKLLAHYGFALDNNPNNEFPVYLDDLQTIPTSARKMNFISENDVQRDMHFSAEGLSWNLCIALRILALAGNSKREEFKYALSGRKISESNEADMHQLCNLLIQNLMKELQTGNVEVDTIYEEHMAHRIHSDSRTILQSSVHKTCT